MKYSRIVLIVVALGLVANFALTERSWKLASTPRVMALGVLGDSPALGQFHAATLASEAELPYPPGATPPAGPQPLRVGLAYREVSLFALPLWAYPEPGLVTYVERPADIQAHVLDPDQVAALDGATGAAYSQTRFPWYLHIWGWLLLVGIIVWTKARTIDIRNMEEAELQREMAASAAAPRSA